jgi:hypothetical protein
MELGDKAKTEMGVRSLCYHPHADRCNKQLPSDDFQQSIVGNGTIWRLQHASCSCRVCSRKDIYKPRVTRIPTGNHVAFDRQSEKCLKHFGKLGYRKVAGIVVCKSCLEFVSDLTNLRDMRLKFLQVMFQEIAEWGKNGITFEAVEERFGNVDEYLVHGFSRLWKVAG